MHVLATAQPGAAHAAAIENVGEAALNHFSASAHGVPPDARFQSGAVGIDGIPRRVVAMPAQIAVGRLWLGDARLPWSTVELLQAIA